MIEEKQSASSLQEKHSCCNAHLKPLLERINSLEHKLLIETERREKEYNELLQIMLVVKKNKKEENIPEKVTVQQIKPISKVTVSGESHNKKAKDFNGVANSQAKASSKGKSAKKVTKPLRRSSQNVKKTQHTVVLTQAVPLKISNKNEIMVETLQRHEIEINKLKQLSNYLMEQLLLLFEKTKEIQTDSIPASSPKNFPTQQTITSIVFDAAQKQAMSKNEMNVNFESQVFSDKVQRLQAMIQANNSAIREQHAKISEHESILSELIALTRGLSNRIVEIPLYLSSPSEASPCKHTD